MPLLNLANELLVTIASHLDTKALNSLIQTTRHFSLLFQPRLYQLAILHDLPLQTGPSSSSSTRATSTILHWASKTGHVGVLTRLLETAHDMHANMDATAPHAAAAACEQGHLAVLQLLIDSFKNWNSYEPGTAVSIPLRNVLRNCYWMVVLAGRMPEPIVKLLVVNGVDATALDRMKRTTLHDLCMHQERWMGTCGMMVAEGLADAGAEGRKSVAQDARLCVVDILLDEGVDVDARDRSERTAMFYCLWNSEQAELMIATLMVVYADKDAKDGFGRTVLHRAAGFYHVAELGYIPRIVQLLLDDGADISVRDDEGETALGIAEDSVGCWGGTGTYQEVLQLLRDALDRRYAPTLPF